MPTLRIDLATRVLNDDMSVQPVHPGARYAFYRTVLRRKALPVDVPFLEIEDGKGVPSAQAIAPMLERARQMRRGAPRPKPDTRTPRPPMDLERYSTALDLDVGAKGARTRLRNAANDILWGLPKGTLVVIPGRKNVDDAPLVELKSRTARRRQVNARGPYTGFPLTARNVRDVTRVPTLEVPGGDITNARTSNAIRPTG